MIGQGFIILTFTGSQGLGQFSLDSWGDPSDTQAVFAGYVSPGSAHSLVYTHNTDTRTEEIFLDGKKINSSTSSLTIDPSTANYSNFYIGRSQFSQDPFYNGSIDEMRVYDNSMTATEVRASYDAGPNVVAVPEPASLALFALGASLAFFRLPRKCPTRHQRRICRNISARSFTRA